MKQLLLALSLYGLLTACSKPSTSNPTSQPTLPPASTENIMVIRDTAKPNTTPFFDIWSIDETCTSKTVRTPKGLYSQEIFDPNWGPDDKLYFISRHESLEPMIYTANADGTGLTRITYENSYYHDLQVSTTGKRLLYYHNNALRSSKLDGTDEKIVATTNVNRGNWHPDGKRVVYTQGAYIGGTGYNNIMIANYDGTNPQPITPTPERYYAYPFVSPDGAKITYYSDSSVYVANIDGSGERLINSPQKMIVYGICGWAKDGQWVLVQGDHPFGIYFIKADGSSIREFGAAGYRFQNPSIRY